MASRILGMGDMLTLIEQAEKTFDADQAEKMAAKLAGRRATSPSTTSWRRWSGPQDGLACPSCSACCPGMGQIKDQIDNLDEREIDRIAAIIQSMTPAERADPKIINGSRRARIAKGSGVEVTEVNDLVERFFEARKMMPQMAQGGGMPGMPGMPGHGLGKKAKGRQEKQQKQAKGKRRSGNPAKRAQEEAAAVGEAGSSVRLGVRPRWEDSGRPRRASTRASCRTPKNPTYTLPRRSRWSGPWPRRSGRGRAPAGDRGCALREREPGQLADEQGSARSGGHGRGTDCDGDVRRRRRGTGW